MKTDFQAKTFFFTWPRMLTGFLSASQAASASGFLEAFKVPQVPHPEAEKVKD